MRRGRYMEGIYLCKLGGSYIPIMVMTPNMTPFLEFMVKYDKPWLPSGASAHSNKLYTSCGEPLYFNII